MTDTSYLITFTGDDLQKVITECIRCELEKIVEQPKTIETQEKLMSVKETASYLGKSEQTIHKWIQLGYLTAYRISDKKFLKQSEIIESLEVVNVKSATTLN
jgi:excisionase family DNA binding protein